MTKLTQEELAELQDPETWEDVGTVHPAAKSSRAVVSVAFSRKDFEEVASFAERHGMKISEFIRRAALERMSPVATSTVISVTGSVQTSYATISPPRPKIEITAPPPATFATT